MVLSYSDLVENQELFFPDNTTSPKKKTVPISTKY